MIEKHNPRNDAAWHRLRAKDITASVAGALIGVHEFTTIYELWSLKTGREFQSTEETDAIRRGRLLEPVAVEFLRELHPAWQIEHNTGRSVIYYRQPEFRLGATPDVIAHCPKRGKGIVQIKSVERSIYRRKWLADNDMPEPPLWIAVQAIIEAYMTGSAWAAVAPLVIGHGVELPVIDIPIIPGVIERIQRESLAFWKMVESGEEPTPDFNRDARAIDAVHAFEQGDEIDLSRDEDLRKLLIERHGTFTARKSAEIRLKAIDAEIKHKMGGATIAHLAGGDKITWKTQRKIGPDGRATAFRVLRTPVIEE